MHSLDRVEDRFRPEPTIAGRTVICQAIYGSGEYQSRIQPILDRLDIQAQSYGLVWDGIAVTFEAPEQAALFRMFYEGDTGDAR